MWLVFNTKHLRVKYGFSEKWPFFSYLRNSLTWTWPITTQMCWVSLELQILNRLGQKLLVPSFFILDFLLVHLFVLCCIPSPSKGKPSPQNASCNLLDTLSYMTGAWRKIVAGMFFLKSHGNMAVPCVGGWRQRRCWGTILPLLTSPIIQNARYPGL